MRKIIAGMAAALLAAVLFFPVKAVSAQSAIVLDASTGRVLYEKNADQQSLIASTTKIMTALVICERCNVLDRVRIPKEAVGIEGSSMYLQEGEILTVQDLLYGLMLRSGNDAAVALAIYCGGTVEGFAQLMNDKAHTLGMKATHFMNPHGLDAPGHYSTARDMAHLSAYAMNNPIFAHTVSTKNVRVGERSMTNHNKLLWQLDGAEGVKTGYTKAAGRILVSSVCRNGRRLIVVTINDPDDWIDHRKLVDDSFTNYTVKQLMVPGQCLGTVSVEGGCKDRVELIAADGFAFSLRQGEKVTVQLPAPGFCYAPVVKNQAAGDAYILVDGVPVGKVALVYGDTIEQIKNPEPSLWDKLFRRAT